jgi:catechol 2,3-dioxygenase-like lactoylglutathione lyase family enzyme
MSRVVADRGAVLATVTGLHHVQVPVSDVVVSSDWYSETFGFERILLAESEDAPTAAVLAHPSGVFVVLRLAPAEAASMVGFALLALSVSTLEPWLPYLCGLGLATEGITESHLGRRLRVADPDGLLVELHTAVQPSADEP